MRTIFFAMLIAAGFAFFCNNEARAAAANGTVVNQAAQDIDATILVRDGCGRGRHYSRYRGMCVWNGQRGYYPVYGYPAYGYPVYGYPVYGYRRGYYWGW